MYYLHLFSTKQPDLNWDNPKVRNSVFDIAVALFFGIVGLFFKKAGIPIAPAVLGMILITTLEFVSGVVINIILGWNVWDYSGLPLNILGQICLPFCFAWLGLSVVAIFIDDGLRYLIFKEPLPKYKIF